MLLEPLDLYALLFCRVVICLVFGLSAIGKMIDLVSFERAMTAFGLLPEQWSRGAASVFLAGELGTAALMLAGSNLLIWGFGMGLALLLIFSGALVLVLVRRQVIACHCFGPSRRTVSIHDLVRNGGLILCCCGGLGLLWAGSLQNATPTLADGILTGIMAVTLAALLINVADIVLVVRPVARQRHQQHAQEQQ